MWSGIYGGLEWLLGSGERVSERMIRAKITHVWGLATPQAPWKRGHGSAWRFLLITSDRHLLKAKTGALAEQFEKCKGREKERERASGGKAPVTCRGLFHGWFCASLPGDSVSVRRGEHRSPRGGDYFSFITVREER